MSGLRGWLAIATALLSSACATQLTPTVSSINCGTANVGEIVDCPGQGAWKNVGDKAVRVVRIDLTGPDVASFRMSVMESTAPVFNARVEPGQTTPSVRFKFGPLRRGLHSAAARPVFDDGANGPGLEVTGEGRYIDVESSVLSVARVGGAADPDRPWNCGRLKYETEGDCPGIVIANGGTEKLDVDVLITGTTSYFRPRTVFPISLNPGASQTVIVSFKPRDVPPDQYMSTGLLTLTATGATRTTRAKISLCGIGFRDRAATTDAPAPTLAPLACP